MKKSFLACSLLIICVRAFLPSKENTNGRPDYTHASITHIAIYRAVADVISNVIYPGKYNSSDPDDIVCQFFSNYELENFVQTVKDIVDENNLAQQNYMSDAVRTMNCEQITAGHLLLQSLRENIIQKSQETKTNRNAILDLIGQYLFTMQEFYSNTNWVEMFGTRVCTELGVPGKSLPVRVSDPEEVTCVNCNYTNNGGTDKISCSDNIKMDRDRQLLTSGYTSYQGINKPIGEFPSGMGKCSHGGPFDNSKAIPGSGGINKETSSPELSPHFYLHQQAGEAATQATIDFLVDHDTGLLSALGLDKFRELMGMDHKHPCCNCQASSGISIDFHETVCASEDIKMAQQHSVNIVIQTLGRAYAPLNFIYTAFDDSGLNTTLRRTKNGTEIKQWLFAKRDLRRNTNCFNLNLGSFVKAIEITDPGSCLFIFLDIGTKYAIRLQRVIDLIKSKGIQVVFFPRGNSNGRNLSHSLNVSEDLQCFPNEIPKIKERNRRGLAGLDLFEKIASATGGKIVHTSSSSLGSILGAFVTKNMGVSSLEVTSFEMPSGSVHTVAVDTDLSLMTVRIEGLSSASHVKLDRPDGTRQIFSGNSSVDVIGRTTVISVKNPPPGKWKLHNNGASTWKVKVGGSGKIDFTYKFMEDVHGIQYPISGTSPITGSKITISVTVNGLPTAAHVTDIILKKPDGAVLDVLPVKDTYSDTSRVLYASYIVTSEEFLVSINGSLNSHIFTREKADIITPVTGSIQFSSKPEKLVLGKSAVVKVNITNTGHTSQSFRVNATSVPAGFVTSYHRSITVGARSSQEINVGVTGSSNTLALLTVKLNIGSTTLQTIKRTLEVTKIEPPQIMEINKTDDCKQKMMNYYNCTKQKWTTVLDIKFKVNMSKLYATPSNVNFSYINKTPTSYIATLSGTCCSYLTRVTAIDVRGNMKSKSFDFSGGNVFNTTVDNFELLVKPSPSFQKKKLPTGVDKTLLYGLIGGGAAGLCVVAVVLAALIHVNKSHRVAMEKETMDSLSSICFDVPLKHVEHNKRLKFVSKTHGK